MGDKSRGLLRNEKGNPGKFVVRRYDGRDGPGEKHDGCQYFVLDLTHDVHARVAARAYAVSCEGDGYHLLAQELIALVDGLLEEDLRK